MKVLFILVSMLMFSWQVAAEAMKINTELTVYIPGFGVEYQLDEHRTIGFNYSALKSANINMTMYKKEAFKESGSYTNVLLGYGDDGTNGTGMFALGKYGYLGSVIGYQWMFQSGVNINVDGGLMLVKSISNGVILPVPAFAASIGYAFEIGD